MPARARRAYIRVNCGGIPQSLIGSELYGHEKGTFTSATQRRSGRFELADGGTIFLDEVGELPMETQVALLHVLQEREFERVGGCGPITVDVRILATANRNLQNAVNDKEFREDLFYRLNVFPKLGIPRSTLDSRIRRLATLISERGHWTPSVVVLDPRNFPSFQRPDGRAFDRRSDASP
jgi:transcriptional regulator with GAF, ATPase, and Fis domain